MNAVFTILIVLVLVTFSVWLWQKSRVLSTPLKFMSGVLCLAILLGASVQVHRYASTPSADTARSEPLERALSSSAKPPHYQRFDSQQLNSLRESGQAIFVNMTAAWCITCLANEKVALSSNKLKAFFKDNQITYLKGDWTNQDAEITQYLQSFGRNSVPLYVYYPAKHDGADSTPPIVLPQILTVETVVDIIKSSTHSTSL